MKKFLCIFLFIFLNSSILSADSPYFLDFKLILNESDAGKKAQNFLKKKLDSGFKTIKEKEKKILNEEKDYSAEKVISNEEYKNKVSELRKKFLPYKMRETIFYNQ